MLPTVVLHNAVSADGRMDGITPDIGLYYGLAGTWSEDLTLCGSRTVCQAFAGQTDRRGSCPPPVLPTAGSSAGLPLLAVVDSRGRFNAWRAALAAPYWRGGIALTSARTPAAHLSYLERMGVGVVQCGAEQVDLAQALALLYKRFKVRQVRVDSGGRLNGALLRAGLVDEVSLLVCPQLVGGKSARGMYVAPDLAGAAAISARLVAVQELAGGYVWLRYELGKPAPRRRSG